MVASPFPAVGAAVAPLDTTWRTAEAKVAADCVSALAMKTENERENNKHGHQNTLRKGQKPWDQATRC